MLRKTTILIALSILLCPLAAQENSWETVSANKEGQLTVYYFENAPFAYRDSKNELNGIEIDIIRYFKEWLWEKKKVKLDLEFIPGESFNQFYSDVESQSYNAIGAGTVTISEERAKSITFSSPYLKNVSVLISDGTVPTLKSEADYVNVFSGLTPVTIKGSIHEGQVNQIIKKSKSGVTPMYVDKPEDIPVAIEESARYYGYIDLISFWAYVKKNSHYVKMHKMANIENEEFAFIFPKKSDWSTIFNEFLESGFGFTATKDYHRILEKHLGFEVIDKVELD